MEKLNLAKLLKDCPKGMELDCVMYENLYFDYISNSKIYPICCYTEDNLKAKYPITFTWYGQASPHDSAKCVIFPKGKTTWEGFIPPCKFKAGDVLYIDCADTESDGDLYKYLFILKEIDSLGHYFSYCYLSIDRFFPSESYLVDNRDNRYNPRLATEEEKQKLFDAIKANGYKWNEEEKTLEKLIEPKFKVGDKVKSNYNNNQYVIDEITDTHYILIEITKKFRYTEHISEDKNWELVPNKFDITTLKPFDKVLVRDSNKDMWCASIFSHTWKDKYFCVGAWHNQCIPYEANKELLGTTNNPE